MQRRGKPGFSLIRARCPWSPGPPGPQSSHICHGDTCDYLSVLTGGTKREGAVAVLVAMILALTSALVAMLRPRWGSY